MTVRELLARAALYVGDKRCRYRLGGGSPWTAPVPWDEGGGCDCSGFACWSLGLARHQPSLVFLRAVTGGWLSTDGIWWDAVLERTGFFERQDGPEVGGIVVYPSARIGGLNGIKGLPTVGHVGIVSAVAGGVRVIHCSAGNYRRTGAAIDETDGAVFRRAGAVFAWCAAVERDEPPAPSIL